MGWTSGGWEAIHRKRESSTWNRGVQEAFSADPILRSGSENTQKWRGGASVALDQSFRVVAETTITQPNRFTMGSRGSENFAVGHEEQWVTTASSTSPYDSRLMGLPNASALGRGTLVPFRVSLELSQPATITAIATLRFIGPLSHEWMASDDPLYSKTAEIILLLVENCP